MNRILLVFLLLCPGTALGANKYVSTTGSDSNSGAIGSPYATFAKAFDNTAAGDTVFLCIAACDGAGSGSFTESIVAGDTPSGSAGNLWTFKAYPGEVVRIVGEIVLSGDDYQVFEGFEVDCNSSASNEFGLLILGGTDNITFRDIEVHHCWESNIHAVTTDGNYTNISYVNIDSHDAGQRGPNPGAPSHGFYLSGTTCTGSNGPILIEGGTYHDNTSDPNSLGITMQFASCDNINNLTARDITVYSNPYGAQFGTGTNHIIYNSVFRNNTNRGLGCAFGTGTCFLYNNLVIDNGWDGISLDTMSVTLQNNLIKDNGAAFSGCAVTTSVAGVVAQNNLLQNNAGGNFCTSGSGSYSSTTPLTTGDPLFVNEAALNFHLTSSSPARGVGANLSGTFTTDFDGVTRSAWDIGPFEFVTPGGNKIPILLTQARRRR